jgi:hypothetical protein
MARALAFAAAPVAPLAEALRTAIVLGSALALIFAGKAFPLI